MSSLMYLYIDKDSNVYKIPKPKDDVYKAIPKLSNQDVLFVTICYSLENRKPYEVTMVSFERILLDEYGGFKYTHEVISQAVHNFINYELENPESLANRNEPIPIPRLPTIPTQAEKVALYDYMKFKYLSLSKNLSYTVEGRIRKSTEIYNKYKNLVKDANMIKVKNNK